MKFLKVAQFEYKKMVRKPSFWLGTLFLPVFMGIVAFVSGYSSMDAVKKMESMETFTKIYVVDEVGVIPQEMYVEPLFPAESIGSVKEDLISDSSKGLVYIPETFFEDFVYEIYFSKEGDILRSANLPMIVESILKNTAIMTVQNEKASLLLTNSFSSKTFSFDSEGNLEEEGFEKFILPVISLVVFFMAVFISSSFLLQSVSAEKENRMIETMLSIIDKKSLMFGKMAGLMGVVLTQLVVWLVFGFLSYYLVNNYFDMPLPIDLDKIDWSFLPLNIFFIIMGFLFFAAVMTGVGAVGTGAEDSKNLSSIFIILSIFPIYLMQSLVTDPSSLMAKIFSYFPFTSFMILLTRNSLGVLSVQELILAIVISILYVVCAGYLALKLFELGCLMYNRRPSFREILGYLR